MRENVSDTNRLGVLPPAELDPLSAYLRAHQGSAYYEAAFDSGTKMGALVERDARPILVLTTLEGRVFTPVARLRRAGSRREGPLRLPRLRLRTPQPPHRRRLLGPRPLGARPRQSTSPPGRPARAGVLWRLP